MNCRPCWIVMVRFGGPPLFRACRASLPLTSCRFAGAVNAESSAAPATNSALRRRLPADDAIGVASPKPALMARCATGASEGRHESDQARRFGAPVDDGRAPLARMGFIVVFVVSTN